MEIFDRFFFDILSGTNSLELVCQGFLQNVPDVSPGHIFFKATLSQKYQGKPQDNCFFENHFALCRV